MAHKDHLRKRKRTGHVVGFYKKDGKTRPVTKSEAQLKQRKLVKGSRHFKGVPGNKYYQSGFRAARKSEDPLTVQDVEFLRKSPAVVKTLRAWGWHDIKTKAQAMAWLKGFEDGRDKPALRQAKGGGKAYKTVTIKGIKMTENEYKEFVKYLNQRRIQKFTKDDVEQFVEHAASEGLIETWDTKHPSGTKHYETLERIQAQKRWQKQRRDKHS